MSVGEASLQVRRATHNDVPVLARWEHALAQEENEREALTLPQREARLREWMASAQCIAHVFEQAKAPAGFVIWGSHGPREIFVRQFYVQPSSRRQGVGRAAVATMRANVWPRDARVSLRVLVGSAAYLAFWRACGFSDFSITLEQLP
jgi:GNAT superfamily N-acetyltransferase